MNDSITRLMCCIFVLALIGTVSAAGLVTAGEQGVLQPSGPDNGGYSPAPGPHPIDFCKLACLVFIHPFDVAQCDRFPRC